MTEQPELNVLVTDKREVADGVVSIELAPIGAPQLPAWDPGAHIDLLIEGVTTRQYSLCGLAGDRDRWRIGVLLDPAGRGSSRYVHYQLEVGDRVRVRGPRNHFALEPAAGYLFIAGGIGITPILPMLVAAETAGATWRLVYGGRRRDSMAFVDDLMQYGAKVEVVAQDESGLLDLAALLSTPAAGTLVYCCGPEPLLEAVDKFAGRWPHNAFHFERFTPRPTATLEAERSFEVELRASGKTISIGPDTPILKAVEEAGLRVPSSCREGICGTCETRVISGLPDHRDSVLEDDERDTNEVMMICVSRSRSDRLVLDL